MKLAGLGLFLNNQADLWGVTRLPGVLQRFGIAYFVVSMLVVFVPTMHTRPIDQFNVVAQLFLSMRRHALQWAIASALLFTWFAVTFGLNVPGCGRGYLGPGGWANNGTFANCTGGAAGTCHRV